MVGIALFCSAGVGIASYMSGAQSVRDLAKERLMGLAESRKDALTDYLSSKQALVTDHASGKGFGRPIPTSIKTGRSTETRRRQPSPRFMSPTIRIRRINVQIL
jgi:hypothetical protein